MKIALMATGSFFAVTRVFRARKLSASMGDRLPHFSVTVVGLPLKIDTDLL